MNLQTPLTKEKLSTLKIGDRVFISGEIYTGRDAAHKRLFEALNSGQPLPVDLENQTIYYVGPCPAKPGQIIGSCGPTTSGRMDNYAPALLDSGLCAMIGKGERNDAVIAAIIRGGAVYFAAIGGAGALISKSVTGAEVVAYDDLGTEAIHRLTVSNFPAIVVIDSKGNNLYDRKAL